MASHGQNVTRQISTSDLTSPETLFPGSGLFVDEGQIRAGGMGIVFKAKSLSLNRTVAIKRIRPEYSRDNTLISRFRREAEAMARFRHANIVQVFELGEDDFGPYIVMEWIDGESLEEFLTKHGKMKPALAISIVCDIAAALEVAHSAGIIHRDIKPANILLDQDDRPYVTDFGLVRVQSDVSARTSETVNGTFLGSIDFVAPEQSVDPQNAVVQSDIWSLAATLYQLLTGETVRTRGEQNVPEWLQPVLFKALRHQPDERYASMSEFSDALKDAMLSIPNAERFGQIDIHGRSELPTPRSDNKIVTRRNILLGSTCGILGVMGWQILRHRPEQRPRIINPASQGSVPEDVAAKPNERAPQLDLAKEIENSLGMVFCLVPPGEFLMGSDPNEPGRREDEQQHLVTLTEPFYMGQCPVTQQEWLKVMGKNPSQFLQGGASDCLRFPVENVSWQDAVSFLAALNQTHIIPGWKYRLPTEAEWEYACRAGATTPFSFGSQLNGSQANCNGSFPYGTREQGSEIARPTKVKNYPENSFGLYDMHGNVWEWCNDWYDAEYYAGSVAENPAGPDQGTKKVVRGGAWNSFAAACRSAVRNSFEPTFHDSSIGLRVICERE